jgi:hypothetical protein
MRTGQHPMTPLAAVAGGLLSAHLAYGAGTGAAFWLFARLW